MNWKKVSEFVCCLDIINEFTVFKVYRFEEDHTKAHVSHSLLQQHALFLIACWVLSHNEQLSPWRLEKRRHAVNHREKATVATACGTVNGATLKRKQQCCEFFGVHFWHINSPPEELRLRASWLWGCPQQQWPSCSGIVPTGEQLHRNRQTHIKWACQDMSDFKNTIFQ